MNATAFALAGYIFWFMLLLAWIAASRTVQTLSGKRAANSFQPDGNDLTPFYGRLSRAHANCYESFPVIGGLLILALATNQAQLTNPLAVVVLGSRIAQSITHLISVSVLAAQIRFFFFLIQLVVCFYWCFQLFGRFVA